MENTRVILVYATDVYGILEYAADIFSRLSMTEAYSVDWAY